MYNNIIIYGMRGVGKTTFGKILSEKLGTKFFDLDHLIVDKIGESIGSFVKKNSMQDFRNVETKTLEELSLDKQKKVLSLGGGTIIFEKNRKILKKFENSLFVYLNATPENIVKHLIEDDNSNRPSLTGKSIFDEIEEVYNQRKDIYLKNAQIVIDANQDMEAVLDEILNKIASKKICIPIVNFDNIEEKFEKIKNLKEISIVELRIDFLKDYKKLKQIISSCPKKTIVTNRMYFEGGNFSKTALESIEILKQAFSFQADLVDVELKTLESIGEKNIFGSKNIIVSYHNFKKTPRLEELKKILDDMKKFDPYVYKIALMPKNSQDVDVIYELEKYFKKNFFGKNYIFISMGELGEKTRYDLLKSGGYLSFASFEESSASGQPNYKDLYKYFNK